MNEEAQSWEDLTNRRSKVVNKNGIAILPRTLESRKKSREIQEREKQFNQCNSLRLFYKHKYRRIKLCVYCGTKKNLTIDHRVPLILGGPDSKENYAWACEPCNVNKGGNLLESDIPLFRYFLKRGMIVESKVPQYIWEVIKNS